MNLLIFSDLDGTLLDHHSYSWEPALPALDQLKSLSIPLILCTSKTAAEVTKLHAELELDTPCIVENGAAIVIDPQADDPTRGAFYFGRSYQELTSLVHSIRQEEQFDFTGFSDMSAAEVAAATGLTLENARLAKQRLCSEPLQWQDSTQALERFAHKLARHKLRLLRGGRFYHVLDSGADKGTALTWLRSWYLEQHPASSWTTVALGDGPNDESMMEAADIAIVIPALSGHAAHPQARKMITAPAPGPAGWNKAILSLLKMFSEKGARNG